MAESVITHASDLTVELRNTRPVPLVELTLSMASLGATYDQFLDDSGVELQRRESQLYIKEIRTGSIILLLAPYVENALPLISDWNNVLQFAAFLKTSYDWLAGKTAKTDHVYSQKQLQNLGAVVKPVINDQGALYNFTAQTGGRQNNYFFTINTTEAGAIENTVRKEIELLKEPDNRTNSKVLLRWYQAKFDRNSNTGDKAVVESISGSPVKVIFANPEMKNAIMRDDPRFTKPWQELAYIVDIETQTISGAIKLYKVLQVYPEDTFDPLI